MNRVQQSIAADRATRGEAWTGTLRVTGARPLTINKVGQMHRQTWATHTREVRGIWHLAAREHHTPRLARCSIVAVPLHATYASPQDVAACAPEVKAAIDGLRDAGVLEDDGPTIVTRISFEAPLVCGVDGLELRIQGVRR